MGKPCLSLTASRHEGFWENYEAVVSLSLSVVCMAQGLHVHTGTAAFPPRTGRGPQEAKRRPPGPAPGAPRLTGRRDPRLSLQAPLTSWGCTQSLKFFSSKVQTLPQGQTVRLASSAISPGLRARRGGHFHKGDFSFYLLWLFVLRVGRVWFFSFFLIT